MNVVLIIRCIGFQGVKRISKVTCGAGKELQRIVLDHLQVTCTTVFTNWEQVVSKVLGILMPKWSLWCSSHTMQSKDAVTNVNKITCEKQGVNLKASARV